MRDISLISKKQKERGLPRLAAFKDSGKKMSLFMRVALALLVVVVIVGIGLFVWARVLNSNAEALEEERKATIAERDATLETRVKTLSTLISAYQSLVVQHRNWSQLFGLIEDKTVPSVTFTSFEGDYAKNVFVLEGRAPNYRTLAEQIKALESSEHLTSVEVEEVTLAKEGLVGFTLTTQFKKDVITGVPSGGVLTENETATSTPQETQ